MRSRPNASPLSFDELLGRLRDLPEGYRGQICDGEMIVAEPPLPPRAHALAELSAMLVAGSALGDPVPESWSFLTNVELAAGEGRLFVADVAGWRCEKDKLAEAANPVQLVPSWVAEVTGGSTRTFTLTAKRRAYAALGVQHLWIVDPEACVLDVFVNQRGRWLLLHSISEELRASAPPFDELHFDAPDLWMRPQATTPSPPSSKKRLS